MANSLFQKFGSMVSNHSSASKTNGNILSQYAMLKNNPGSILDILLQNGKINQRQYYELQQFKNNPEAIGKYLINSGYGQEITQAEKIANNN